MFFAHPFILASQFIQHVMLLVLCGLVATEYCARSANTEKVRRERSAFGIIGVTVLLMSFGIIVEYFIPAKVMQFHLLVSIPLMLAVVMFMFRVNLYELPRAFTIYRLLLIGVLLVNFAIDTAQILFAYHEPVLLRSIIKTIEVFGLFGFVLHYARHFAIQAPIVAYVPGSTKVAYLRSSIARAAIVLVLLLGFTSQTFAFSLTTRIGDQSTELKAGDRLYFDVEIKWPENDRRQDLRVEYQILDQGQVIASEKVLRAVETQASFLDYLVVPTSAVAGVKELRVVLETYDKSLSESISATFNVAKGENKLLIYFVILASAIALVVLLVIFQIVMITRTQRLLASQQRSH